MRTDPDFTAGKWAISWLFCALALAICPGVVTLRTLRWPYDLDGFRDIAFAQAALDGSALSDPFYLNEKAWYNPLVPTIVSVVARITERGVPETFVSIGPWLNAIAPVGYFVFLRRLLGPWPALMATCAFLFLPGRPPGWASGTYSPWLFPSITAQGPLYLGLAAWVATLASAATRWPIVAGVLLGLTVLAHAAAAMLFLSIVIVTTLVGSAWQRPVSRLGRYSLCLLTCGVGFVVSAPFVLPIATEYQFRIVNRAPAIWPYAPAHVAALAAGSVRPAALVQLLVALVGWRWIGARHGCTAARVLLSWAFVALCGLLYTELTERSLDLPAAVPAYHFLFLLHACKWAYFGGGLYAAAVTLNNSLSHRLKRPISTTLVFSCVIVMFLVATYPRYLGREAFTTARDTAEQVEQSEDPLVYQWIQANTPPWAVFVSSDIDALRVIAPAGRHVVCVYRFFSNPYVYYEERAEARDKLFATVMSGDNVNFHATGAKFRVTHVLARGSQASAIKDHSASWTTEEFRAGTIVVFRVH